MCRLSCRVMNAIESRLSEIMHGAHQHTLTRLWKTEVPADKTLGLCVFWSSIKDEKSVCALTLIILSIPYIFRVKSSVSFFKSKQNLSGNLWCFFFFQFFLTAGKSFLFIMKNKPVEVLFSLSPAPLNIADIHMGNKLTIVLHLSTFISVWSVVLLSPPLEPSVTSSSVP